MAIRMVEIANRIVQLEVHFVTERTARMDSEQHVQTLTTQLQTLSSNPNTQKRAQSKGWTDTNVWRKPGKLDASAKGAWSDWEPLMLSYIGQWDRNLMNANEALSGVLNPCHERELERRPRARQQLDFALPAHDDRHGKSV